MIPCYFDVVFSLVRNSEILGFIYICWRCQSAANLSVKSLLRTRENIEVDFKAALAAIFNILSYDNIIHTIPNNNTALWIQAKPLQLGESSMN